MIESVCTRWHTHTQTASLDWQKFVEKMGKNSNKKTNHFNKVKDFKGHKFSHIQTSNMLWGKMQEICLTKFVQIGISAINSVVHVCKTQYLEP